ncbi:MAG: ABC transporter substrate-binding protein [bacterium]
MRRNAHSTLATCLILVFLVAFGLQAAPAPQAGAPQRGGTLVVVTPVKPDMLDPSIHFNTLANRISRNTHDSLVSMENPNKFVPALAERWEVARDFKTFTFFLRRDVRFHDGTPLTAEAVKATWERSLDPVNRAAQAQLFGKDPKIEVLNASTIRISFSEPHPRFLQQVSLPQLGPGSPVAWQRMGQAYLMSPVGTGPFKVEGWPNENTLVLARHADYKWGPSYGQNRGAPYVDRIIFRFVPEEAARTLALERREIHIAEEPARQSVNTYRSDQRFQIVAFQVPGLPQNWPFNTTRWPSYELAVRRAVAYAIDRERIAKVAFFGTVNVAYGPLTQSNWAFWPEAKNYHRYDPKKSTEILEGAGFKKNASTGIYEKDGKPLRMRLVTSSTDDQVKQGTMVQAMLREVGIDLVVEAMSTAASFARYRNNDYELARHGLNTVDPDGLSFAYHTQQISTAAVSNRGRLTFKALDLMLERGRAATDPEERKRIYWQIQKMLLDMANSVYTTEATYFTVGLSCVHGFRWNANGYTEFHDTWLSGDCRTIGQ